MVWLFSHCAFSISIFSLEKIDLLEMFVDVRISAKARRS